MKTLKKVNNILLLDDDLDVCSLISEVLCGYGYQVKATSTIEAFWNSLNLEKADVIILDLNLEKSSGYEVCRKIKTTDQFKNIPIIVFSSKDDEIEIVSLLDIGVDDFVSKRYTPHLLGSKIGKCISRIDSVEKNEHISIPGVLLDYNTFKVSNDDFEAFLTRSEFKLFTLLCSKPNQVFSREDIIKNLRGENYSISNRIIDVFMQKIRKKIVVDSLSFETIRGKGYRAVIN